MTIGSPPWPLPGSFYPQARSILIIGAEKFGLIQLDRQGNYRTFRANTGCAAGTGSFLDQQALRLKLENTAALSALAQRNTGAIPKIASRCAVFAKTDLVHAQQEGYLLEEICDGLCYGLAKNVVDVLFSGQTPLGPVLLTGGVAKQPGGGRPYSQPDRPGAYRSRASLRGRRGGPLSAGRGGTATIFTSRFRQRISSSPNPSKNSCAMTPLN